MDIVIIEDEWLLAEELEETLLHIDPSFNIVAKLQSIDESVQWLQSNNCDLIFMDIQLGDGLSFSIFEKTAVSCPIIFTTAFDQYAIQAFEVNSIAYLLKPIDINDLRKALDKHNSLKQSYLTNIKELISTYIPRKNEYKKHLVLTQGYLKKVMNTEQISYFQADDRYVFAFTQCGQRLFCDYPLKELEAMLDPMSFFRVNRAYLVRRGNIIGWSTYTKGKLKVFLEHGSEKELIVSGARALDFKKWISL